MMEARKTANALIRSTMLGINDRGNLTFLLILDYGDSEQAAGTYSLDEWLGDKEADPPFDRRGCKFGAELIRRILWTLEVDNWEDLRGKLIQAQRTHTKVHAIGNWNGQRWLDFEEFFKEMEKIGYVEL